MIALLLAATLFLTPEQPVSETRRGVVAADWFGMHSATNGETRLVVWNDVRGVQAARFDAQGRQLDAQTIGLPLTRSPWTMFWNGAHWVVMNPTHFVRVDADGKLLDRTQRPLGLGTDTVNMFRAAWTGSAALIATTSDRATELVVWRFDREMNLNGRIDFTPLTKNWSASLIDLVSNGSSAVLFYYDNVDHELHAAWFDRFGQLERDRVMARHRSFVSSGAAGTDGDGYALVYRPDPFQRVWQGFLLDRDFNREGIPAFTVGEPEENWFELPHIVHDGSGWTAYFARLGNEQMDVDAMRIAADGSVDPPVRAFSFDLPEYNNESPHVQAVGGTTLAFYREDGPKALPVAKVRAASSPEGLGSAVPADLATGVLQQTKPVAAAGATQSIVAWREELAPGDVPAILATRIDGRGQVLERRSIVLGGTPCSRVNMAAASDGGDFLVAWRDLDAIAGAIVRADGTTQPVRISNQSAACQFRPMAVASNGSSYLVLWAMPGEFEDRLTMSMVRVGSDGTVLDAQPMTFNSKIATPFLATDGNDFLVVSGDEARRVTADGVLLDSRGIDLDGTALGVWWNGSAWVVAARDDGGIRVRSLDRSGAISSDTLHAWTDFAPFTAASPRCDASGCSYVSYADGKWVVARLEEDAVRVEPIAVTFAAGDEAPRDVSLAGPFLVYSRRVLDLGNASRVFLSRLATMRGRAARH